MILGVTQIYELHISFKVVWSENITYELNQNVLIAEKEAATRGVL